MLKNLRPLAIYLPQFHPIKENNEWWGKGFTEWTNVTKAFPRFSNHYQPHLPTDLGFYDLRLSETREQQAQLAKEHGIEGFCYYHYWFNGKQVLETPLKQVLKLKKPDFPFCVCWANENWTKRWDGLDNEVLMRQEYSLEDDRKHIQHLFEYFEDERYIKVDGKPLFIIYRPDLFPEINNTTNIWREEAQKRGLKGLYLAYMQGFNQTSDPATIGFDAAVEFQPDFWHFPKQNINALTVKEKLLRKLNLRDPQFHKDTYFDYNEIIDVMIHRKKHDYKVFPSVFPMWDNSARKKMEATIITGSSPELYGKWLNHTVQNFKPYSKDENFIFINAWNEWAEGNHLEPCVKWGTSYLETTKRILKS